MVINITFQGLPFLPKHSQVLYIDVGSVSSNDSLLFVRKHYEELCTAFRTIGRDFYSLPMLTDDASFEEKVRYYAPYLDSKLIIPYDFTSAFLRSIVGGENSCLAGPCLLFNGVGVRSGGKSFFRVMPLPKGPLSVGAIMESFIKAEQELSASEEEVSKEYQSLWEKTSEGGRKLSLPSSSGSGRCMDELSCEHEECAKAEAPAPLSTSSLPPAPPSKAKRNLLDRFIDYLGSHFREEEKDAVPTIDEIEENRKSLEVTRQLLSELNARVQQLRLEGVSLMAIHEFIDKQEPLSRMVITEDFRILLPDYNNMEIEMGALPMAVYFLFLRYPEGIVCKHMPDHYNELLNIYRQLRPHTDEARLALTVTKVVNPLGNALNENIARIKKAFVEKFDEHLACNYIIAGKAGDSYSIPLDRDLVEWE